ncbi:MAG: LTA synthase family protein [Eubacterium sp.]|jgi:phosphoglycerol transferase MdoB-like AlkP superfamily enzyme
MSKLYNYYKTHINNGILGCVELAFLLELFIEIFARKGIAGVYFMFQHPLIFFDNVLIILSTLVVGCLFRKRNFYIGLVASVWAGVGVTNGVILMERMTPFTVKDISSITDAATILTNYFNGFELFLIATLLVFIGAMGAYAYINSKRKPRVAKFHTTFITVAVVIALTIGSTYGLVKTGGLQTFFGNLAYGYRDCGLPYCFLNTWFNTGIKRPADYSEEAVKDLLPEENTDSEGNEIITTADVDENYPNILFLQLESFTDPELFSNIGLSEDAIPYFRQLSEEYSSGYLTVPACGAGTANTEFEVMTGLSVKFFGPGEYPFKSVLRDEPAESAAFDLKYLGFGTHAIHNHRAFFYNRNEVFANIGFDTFTSVEYMSDVEKTPKNWAKDKILTQHIFDALESTESRDYIYTISVQGHGKYPDHQVIEDPAITVTTAPSDDMKWKYEYYVNQLYEMDKFIKDLTDRLSEYDEPVILVMYGDHIPALEITDETYDRSLYETPYVIWTNYESEEIDEDLMAYELTAEVFDRLGIHTGTVFTYEQAHADDDSTSESEYLEGLKMIGYDMLYGKRYVYGGECPFETVDMQMGVKQVKVDSIIEVRGKYYIKGQNFTEYSKVTLNGQTLSTIYLSPNMLGLEEKVDPEDVKDMKVSQIDPTNKEIISSTE